MSEQDTSKVKSAGDKQDEEISDESLEKVAGGVRPPSGDSNPSDLSNSTVDSGDIIDPQGIK